MANRFVSVDENYLFPAPLEDRLASKFVNKGDLYVNVKDYGAKGDGVSDDTNALNAAATAAFALDPDAVLMIPRGKYKISGPVNVKCALDASQATLNYSGVGDALIVGNVDSPGIVTSRRMYILPRIVRVGAASYDGSSRGVRLVNLNSCIITSQFIQHFEEGLVVEGDAQGSVHNIIYPGTLWGNRRNIVLRAGLTGWVNENMFLGGRLSSPTWGVADDPLSNFILIEESQGTIGSPNSNKFIGTSLEGPNRHLYRVEVAGNYNMFDYCRWEHAADQVVRIRYRTSANYTDLNGGYDQSKVVEVFDGPTVSNKRTVQTGAFYARTNSLNATTLQNDVSTDITTWVPPTGLGFTYNAATGEVMPRPGRYLIRAKISFASSVAAGNRTVRIFKGSVIQSVVTVAGKVGPHTVEVSDTMTFNGTETFKIQANQDSGQSCALTVSAGYSLLSAELIQ